MKRTKAQQAWNTYCNSGKEQRPYSDQIACTMCEQVKLVSALNDSGICFDCLKSERLTVKVSCEACGATFEPEHGYYEVDKPEEGNIGYSYCSECCHW